jgi:hypothetical protein
MKRAPLVVTFCNSPQLSPRVGLNLSNVIKSATFHCYLQLQEQDEVARSKVREVGRVWDCLGLDHGVQCKLTRDCPAPPSGDRAQILLSHVPFANLQLEFDGMY